MSGWVADTTTVTVGVFKSWRVQLNLGALELLRGCMVIIALCSINRKILKRFFWGGLDVWSHLVRVVLIRLILLLVVHVMSQVLSVKGMDTIHRHLRFGFLLLHGILRLNVS